MDERLVAEILATCDAIGYFDETTDKYVKDPQALECVKDLVLYLRRDDDDHSVRRLLGTAGVVGRDLLPLLVNYAPQDMELFDVILRLLVNLTHPALLLYEEEVPKNKKYLSFYMEIESQLRQVKEAFIDKGVWMRLADRLRTLLNLDWEKRMEDDRLALERILVITRNILTVAADSSEEMRTDDEASLHDRLLMVIHLSGLEDLLLFIASSDSTKEYCLHVLEIVSVMMRDTSGETLARTEAVRNEEDRVKDSKELSALLHKERELKRIQVSAQATTRHSRFGGTFSVQGLKGASGRELLCHKPIKSTADLSLDATKKSKKKPSNRVGIQEENTVRRSTVPVRLILKEFCSEFLDNAYNSIMSTVKDNIVRGRMQDHDETYYLWAMKFFMEFNRFQKEFRVSHVSETMSTGAFHYVQTLLDTYHSMMITDKEKVKYWSKRAHMALKAYQELLYTLLWMDSKGSRYVRESSRVIKSNVFYLPEYRELCLGLLNSYDPVRLSKLYLIDLVETNHLFLKMLEEFSKGQGKVIIKTKGKKRARKSNKNGKGKKKRATMLDEDELAEAWEEQENRVREELLKEKEGDGGPTVIPFDAASDIPIDDQKNGAVDRVAMFLHSGRIEEAVTLFKNAREVWPDAEDLFGIESEELPTLKNIYISKGMSPKVVEVRKENEGQVQEDDEQQRNEDEEEEEEDEEEEIRETSKEMEFDFFSFLLKYASPKVVGVYGRLWVEEWEALQPRTIHALLRFFHRLVFQMDYPALLAQVSIFKAFHRVLTVAPYDPKYKDAAKFFLHFWPKFISLVEKRGSVMWVEALFWKSGREATEIQEGCQSASASASQKPRRGEWSEDDISQLKLLVDEFEEQRPEEEEGGRRLRKSKEKRLLEFVALRWTGVHRSSKAFKNKLVDLELLTPTEKRARPPKEWAEEEVEKIRAVWAEVKVEWWEADKTAGIDVMERVLGMLGSVRGRANVVMKMVELGLIRHKNEVGRGKREIREDAKQPTSREFIEDDDSSTSEEESDGDDEKELTSIPNAVPDMEEAVKIGRDLVKDGKIEGSVLKWVAQSLRYFLEDLEDGDEESVPLVPIGGESIAAVARVEVKTFFRTIGFMPPGQGEAFWRIPGTWKAHDVQTRQKVLEDIEKKEGAEDAVRTESVAPRPADSSPRSDKDDDSSSESDNSLTNGTFSSKGPSQRSKISSSTSSSDNEIETEDTKSEQGVNKTSRRRTSRRIVLDSDEDDDLDNTVERSPHKVSTPVISSDLLDSPKLDDKETSQSGETKKRKRLIIDSDSE